MMATVLHAACRQTMAEPLSTFLSDTVVPDVFTYRTVAGHDLRLYVFHPPTANAPQAAVVFIHGGAWMRGQASDFFPHARYFATRGSVACSVEYRLLSADGSTTLADAISDCTAAVEYLRAHASRLNIDPKRVAVVGDSAGGHLAACLATTMVPPASRADAAVLCNPIVDLTEGTWFKFATGGTLIADHAPATSPTAEQLARATTLSPMTHIAAGLPPTFVLHGLDDHTVSPDQSRRFAAAMRLAGNDCQLGLIEHARHAFVMTNYTAPEPIVVDAVRRIDRFLVSQSYLSGDPTLRASDPVPKVP